MCNLGERAEQIEDFFHANVRNILFELKSGDSNYEKLSNVLFTQYPHLLAEYTASENKPCVDFVRICLILLEELACSLQAKSDPAAATKSTPPALSVNDQMLVLSCFQFIIGLGTSQYLLAGVGVPLHKRSEMSEFIVQPTLSNSLSEHQQLLDEFVKRILQIISEPTLGSIIMSKYLHDILAALLQLCFAPVVKSEEMASSAMSQQSRTFFRQELTKLTEQLYQPLLIRELLVLQSQGAVSISWNFTSNFVMFIQCLFIFTYM